MAGFQTPMLLKKAAWFKNSLFWVTQAQRIHPSKLEG